MKYNYSLALLTAFLLWLAWPPMPFTSPLLFIALVPLLLAVENILESDVNRKGLRVFRTSFLSFVIWNTACIYWVFNSLHAVMPAWLAILISIIPFGLGSLLMTIAFWLYFQMRKLSSRWLSYAALICFWIAYEYLHQTWDLSFPWMNLGNGFAREHYLIQWYEFTGVYGGTYWVLMSNILIFEAYLTYRAVKNPELQPAESTSLKKKQRQLVFRSVAHILIPIVISLFMYYRFEEKVNPANVVVVQPNIDPYAKFGSMPAARQVQTLIHLSDSVGQANTEYFIWPETAIAKDTEEASIRTDSNFLKVQDFLNKYRNGNVLTGIESYSLYPTARTQTARLDKGSGKYFDVFNAAIQIENSPRVQFYHKSNSVLQHIFIYETCL
jgi:apolipoprotein N-acyltransferase